MVAETVDILLAEIEGNGIKSRKVEIGGPLILRGSAKIPHGWEELLVCSYPLVLTLHVWKIDLRSIKRF